MTSTPIETTEPASKSPKSVLLAAPLVLFMVYSLWDSALETSQAAVEAPALFKSVERCEGGGDAAFYARSARDRARLKMARYAFYPADGPQALNLLSEAEQCFLAAGEKEDAQNAATTRKDFAERVNDDYRGHRLRLSQALKRQRLEDAHHEARALISLLRDQPKHAYVRWLNSILRK